MIKDYFLNLRAYSWIDLILLGFLAKFSIIKSLIFELTDLYMIIGLLSLWFFFNLILEFKHKYQYRGKTSILPSIIFLILAMIIGILVNPISMIFIASSTLFVFIYLQKNKNALLGNFSSIARGLIASSYFLFAITLFTSEIQNNSVILALSILLIYLSRSLVGDLRDIKHNKKENKKTFPVTFGIAKCKLFIIVLLIITLVIQKIYFGSYLITFPLILFGLFLIFYKNGYVLHQLMILTTSFFHINLITLFIEGNLLFINLIYLGILLNFIFYPLLKRKSNPDFK